MTVLATTLSAINAQRPCEAGWRKLITAIGPDYGDTTPFPLAAIAETNGIDDALWALRCVPPEIARRIAIRFACDCIEHVLPIWEGHYPQDQRPRDALKMTCLYAFGSPLERPTRTTVHSIAKTAYVAARYAATQSWPHTANVARAAGLTIETLNIDGGTKCIYIAYVAGDAAYTASLGVRFKTRHLIERTWQKQHLIELLENAP